MLLNIHIIKDLEEKRQICLHNMKQTRQDYILQCKNKTSPHRQTSNRKLPYID